MYVGYKTLTKKELKSVVSGKKIMGFVNPWEPKILPNIPDEEIYDEDDDDQDDDDYDDD